MIRLWTRHQFIYIYAFSRRFYPKRLILHSGYTFLYVQIWDDRTPEMMPTSQKTSDEANTEITTKFYYKACFRPFAWGSGLQIAML